MAEPKHDVVEPLIKSHFLNLFQIALSDTEIHPEELKFLYDFGISRGVDQEKIDELIDNPHKIRFEIPSSIYERIEFLFDFAKMVLADGKIDPREIKIFKNLAKDFEFQEDNIPEIIDFLIEETKKGTEKNKMLEMVRDTINA